MELCKQVSPGEVDGSTLYIDIVYNPNRCLSITGVVGPYHNGNCEGWLVNVLTLSKILTGSLLVGLKRWSISFMIFGIVGISMTCGLVASINGLEAKRVWARFVRSVDIIGVALGYMNLYLMMFSSG